MAHALHQFAQVGPGVGHEEIPRVAQVVEVDAEQAGSGQRGQPNPTTEVTMPHRPAAGAGKDQGVCVERGVAGQVRADVGQNHRRYDDCALARIGLGRPK